MFKIKRVILFSIILFFIFIPKASAKYIFLGEMEFEFQVENPDTQFDSINLSARNLGNKTIFTIEAVDSLSGIAKLDFYMNNQVYQVFEYQEVKLEIIETVEIEIQEIPFYAEFYVIGTDFEGNALESDTLIPNYFRIYNLTDLLKFRELQNTGETDFEGEDIYLMNDIDLSSISNWTPIGTENNPFCGNFYGNLHTISNLNLDVINDCKGFFAQNNGIISELTVTGNIRAHICEMVGGIVGKNQRNNY